MIRDLNKLSKVVLSIIILLIQFNIDILNAQVIVSSVFSDNMVLQREKTIPIWGMATPDEKITVKFSDQTKETIADKNGDWKVYLDPLKVNTTGTELKINDTTFTNILVGDVWLVSGQSNMQKSVDFMGSIGDEILSLANNDQIRLFNVPKKVSKAPLKSIDANWEISTEISASKFSAIGMVMALKIQSKTDVPIGIINSSLGSTSAMCWVPEEIVNKDPFIDSYKYWSDAESNWDTEGYKPFLEKALSRHKRKGKGAAPTKEKLIHITESRTYPTGAFNAMLSPIFPFAIKGIVWRQGEANVPRANQYKTLLPIMIAYWREQFHDTTLPFIQIGLPSYGKINQSSPKVAELRLMQNEIAQEDKFNYYVPILDLIDISKNKADIHPKNKYLAGERTANLILNEFYSSNQMDLMAQYDKIEIKKEKIIVSFSNVDEGLFTGKLVDLKGENIEKKDELVNNFWIADNSKQFVRAKAKVISKNEIEIWIDSIKKPIAIRYAWEGAVLDINLYNGNNFPVNTFRSDDWELSSKNKIEPKVTLNKP